MPSTAGSLIFNTKIDTSGMEKDAKGISAKVVDLRNKVSSTAAAVKNLREELDKTANTKVKTKAAESLEKEIDRAWEKLDSLDVEADRIVEKKRAEFGIAPKDDRTLDYFLQQDKQWQKLQSQITATEEKLSSYKARLSRVNNAAPEMRDTAEYKKKEQRLGELTGQLEVYKAKLNEAEAAEQQNANRTAGAAHSTRNYRQYLRQTVSALKMFASGLAKAGSALRTAFSKTAGRLIRNIGSHFKSAGHSANDLEKGLHRIKSMLVRMFFFRLVHSPIDAIKDGLGKMSKLSPEVNRQLSALKTSSDYLKNSFASLAAPLLNLVTPALVRFMGTVSAVSDSVARLIAVLSGRKTYTKAVKVQQDYAASLDKTTDNVKENTKAVRENQKNLAGYDRLNVMSDENTADTSLQSISTQPIFENVTAQINGAEKSLLNALKRQDWKSIGKLIGSKLNRALSKIDWNTVKKNAAKWGTGLANLFNGFLDEADPKAIGNTIAQFINTGIGFLKSFVFTFDWQNFGKNLKETLAAFFKNLSIDDLIDTFTGFINGLVTAGIELVGDPEEWKQWGADLEQNVSDAIKGINWKNVKTLFQNLLKGVFNFGDGFFGSLFDDVEKELDGKDFNELGHNAAKAVKNIDWEKIFGKDSTIGKGIQVISKTVIAALDWLIGFLEEPGTAARLSKGVSTLLENVDWADLLIKALTAIFDAVTWITETAAELVDDFCEGLGNGFENMDSDPKLMKSICKLGASISNMFLAMIEAGLNLTFQSLPNALSGLMKYVASEIAKVGYAVYKIFVGKEVAAKWYLSAVAGIVDIFTTAKYNSPKISLPRLEPTVINGKYTNIPKFATGTVVPANYGEFLAVLGDNKREREFVSPESSMKKMFLEALAESGYSQNENRPIYVNVVLPDGTVLFKTVAREDDIYAKTHGRSRFERRQYT